MPTNKPGEGLFGWLGRQVGHVKKAVRTDVEAKGDDPANQVVYRKDTVHEAPHPENPDLKLRRTVIDEVIVDPAPKPLLPATPHGNDSGSE